MGMAVLTDVQWAMLEPLIETCRPHHGHPPSQSTAKTATVMLATARFSALGISDLAYNLNGNVIF
jgi:hypothetical protein